MTYCAAETKLLQNAGEKIAKELLPEPFQLWFSSHDTGCQMTIVVKTEDRKFLTVWQGSIWYRSNYEFNDRAKIPGLQPDFAFAEPVITKYFDEVRKAVETRDREWAATKAKREAAAQAAKAKAIDSVRAVVG